MDQEHNLFDRRWRDRKAKTSSPRFRDRQADHAQRNECPLPSGLFTFEPDVRESSRVSLGYLERVGSMRQYDMSVTPLRTLR